MRPLVIELSDLPYKLNHHSNAARAGAPTPMTDLPAKPAPATSRIVLGFTLAPLLPAFYATMFFAQPWAFPIGLGLAYPAAVLFGLPMFLLLLRRGWLGWWQLALIGALCALPVVALYWHVGTPPHVEAFDLPNALIVEAWGIFTGVAFWLLALAGTTPVSTRVLLGLGF
jgi:hypothetical protein